MKEYPKEMVDYILKPAKETESPTCRICCKKENVSGSITDTYMIESFETRWTLSIQEIIAHLTSTPIDAEELPCSICWPCCRKILKCFLFVKDIQSKEKQWHDAVSHINSCIKSVTEGRGRNIIPEGTDTNKKSNGSKGTGKLLRQYYQCDHCNVKYVKKDRLEEHIKSHSSTCVECSYCAKLFKSEKSLKKHRLSKCSFIEAEGNLICKDCFKVFKTHAALMKHRLYTCQKEISAVSVVCEHCAKVCKNTITLNRHMLVCSKRRKNDTLRNESPFKCDMCNATFCLEGRLKHHIKNVHTDRNIPCEICGKLFKTVRHAMNHMVVHTKEKHFKCEYCEKNFVAKNALIYHQRLHTGERPYACSMCDERFLSASRRMTHVRKKHIGRKFACRICRSKFHSSYDLKHHEERHFKANTKLPRLVFD